MLIGKLAGAAKEISVAWRYGAGETVDAYTFIFNLVTWPVAIWFSILSVVLIPLVTSLRQRDPAELKLFGQELMGVSLVSGLVFWSAAFWLIPLALRAGLTGLGDEALSQAIDASKLLATLAPLGIAISVLSAWMMACGRHGNTLLEAVPALTILIAVLFSSRPDSNPLLVGTVVGFGLHFFTLAMWAEPTLGLPKLRFGFSSTAWLGFSRGFVALAGGQVIMSLSSIVDQFFAADLPSGALATLNYANRILALFLGMGAIAISRATLPVLSEMRASGEGDLTKITLRWSWIMFMVGLVALLVGALLAIPMVALLFERGAFNYQDTRAVAMVFRFLLLQLPFYLAGMVLVSGLAAMGRYKAIAVGATVNLLFKCAFNLLVVHRFGLLGLAFSTAGMYVISFFFLLWVTLKDVSYRASRG